MAEDTLDPGCTPLIWTRTFYSSVSAEKFFQRLEALLEEQHKATLTAQEVLAKQFNGSIVPLTSKLERLIHLLDPRRSQSSSPNGNKNRGAIVQTPDRSSNPVDLDPTVRRSQTVCQDCLPRFVDRSFVDRFPILSVSEQIVNNTGSDPITRNNG